MRRSRPAKTRTLSISVDPAIDKILKEEAQAHFDGNVSRLVAAMALEARRKAAIERIAEWSGYAALSGEERDEIDAGIQKELATQQKRKKKRSAA